MTGVSARFSLKGHRSERRPQQPLSFRHAVEIDLGLDHWSPGFGPVNIFPFSTVIVNDISLMRVNK